MFSVWNSSPGARQALAFAQAGVHDLIEWFDEKILVFKRQFSPNSR